MLTTLLVVLASAVADQPVTVDPDTLAPSAVEPDADLMALAKRQRTTGWIEIGAGAGAIGGGLTLMIAGRPSGALSDETNTVHELRTMGGIGVVLVGITTMLIGGNTLSVAAATRDEAMITLTPEPVAQGAGFRLNARF